MKTFNFPTKNAPKFCWGGISSVSDYSAFGVQLENRVFEGEGFRYGYQGSERDNEAKGDGNSYTTEFRQLDPRLGRWLSTDPVTHPHQSPYCSMDNNPVYNNDVLGLYSKNKAERMAERGAKNGYSTSVVENPDKDGDFGVKFVAERTEGTYRKTQYEGKFRGIGKSGLSAKKLSKFGFVTPKIIADPVEKIENVSGSENSLNQTFQAYWNTSSPQPFYDSEIFANINSSYSDKANDIEINFETEGGELENSPKFISKYSSSKSTDVFGTGTGFDLGIELGMAFQLTKRQSNSNLYRKTSIGVGIFKYYEYSNGESGIVISTSISIWDLFCPVTLRFENVNEIK